MNSTAAVTRPPRLSIPPEQTWTGEITDATCGRSHLKMSQGLFSVIMQSRAIRIRGNGALYCRDASPIHSVYFAMRLPRGNLFLTRVRSAHNIYDHSCPN